MSVYLSVCGWVCLFRCMCVCVCTHTCEDSNMMGHFHLWDPQNIDWKGHYLDWPVNCLSYLVLWDTRTIVDLNSCTCSPLTSHTEMLNIAVLCRMLPHTRGTMSTHDWPWETLESTIQHLNLCLHVCAEASKTPGFTYIFGVIFFFFILWKVGLFGIWNSKNAHSSYHHLQQALS